MKLGWGVPHMRVMLTARVSTRAVTPSHTIASIRPTSRLPQRTPCAWIATSARWCFLTPVHLGEAPAGALPFQDVPPRGTRRRRGTPSR